jgi:hypothetical protein
MFRIQFTASRKLRDNLREAQDLLRHRVPDGDIATIFERALEALIEQVKKERFATGRKPRPPPSTQRDAMPERGVGESISVPGDSATSRHIPHWIKRAVYERDGGRCTFTDASGRRCAETGALQFDHVDGFARTRVHDVERIRLLCRGHNQHAANQIYGREFMEVARRARGPPSPGPGSTPLA